MEEDDLHAFKQAIAGIKPLKQDKHLATKAKPKPAKRKSNEALFNIDKKAQADFAFSDLYQAHFDTTGPLKYCRDDIPAYTLKQLRRGDYSPEWVLDCHGMTKQEMKNELIALLYRAQQQHIGCISILHGIGSGVLKQSLPHYLVQHPKIQAFHQAPLEYGGHGALLVLLEVPEIE